MDAALGKGAPVTFEYTGTRGSRKVTPAMACRRGRCCMRVTLHPCRTLHAQHFIANRAHARKEKYRLMCRQFRCWHDLSSDACMPCSGRDSEP